MLQGLAHMLGLHRVADLTRRKNSGAKLGTPRKPRFSPSVSVSPMRRVPWLGMPMMSPAIGVFGQFAVLGEEELRRVDRHVFAGARQPRLHAAREWPEQKRTKAMRSRWLGSMLAWILNTKPVIFASRGSTLASRLDRLRRGREFGQGVEQVAHAEIVEGAAEKHRGQMAFAERLRHRRAWAHAPSRFPPPRFRRRPGRIIPRFSGRPDR